MEFLLKVFLLNLLPIVTGVFVTKKGKPYNIVLTAIHKIVSLTIIVVTVILFLDFTEQVKFDSLGMFFAIMTAISYLAVIGTGGKLTHKEEGNEKIVIAHKGTTVLLLIFLFLTIYL